MISPTAQDDVSNISDASGEEQGDETSQETMLDNSVEEKKQAGAKSSSAIVRALSLLRRYLRFYVLESCATGARFVHLLVIFVPVILASPVTLFGSRVKDRDCERTGTLWWYGFLVRALETAGATFIKVCVYLTAAPLSNILY